MPHGPCPLCGQPGCLMGEAQSGPDAISYWCQPHCDTFRIGSAFLKFVWPTVTDKDKRAIAAYMQATKGPQRVAPLIQGDNYRAYVTHGHSTHRQEQKTKGLTS